MSMHERDPERAINYHKKTPIVLPGTNKAIAAQLYPELVAKDPKITIQDVEAWIERNHAGTIADPHQGTLQKINATPSDGSKVGEVVFEFLAAGAFAL